MKSFDFDEKVVLTANTQTKTISMSIIGDYPTTNQQVVMNEWESETFRAALEAIIQELYGTE